MSRSTFLLVVTSLIPLAWTGASAQETNASTQEVDYTQHFRVFTRDGQPASLDDIVQAMTQAEAVLVGEIHTDPVGHTDRKSKSPNARKGKEWRGE